MKFRLRLLRLHLLKAFCDLDHLLGQELRYRRFVGGKWWCVTEIESGDTYWTQLEPAEWHMYIHEEIIYP